MNLCETVIRDILKKDLGYTKKCSRWVPRLLTPEHKAAKVKMAEDFLAKIEADPEGFKKKVVTMDESWVSHFQPESKQQVRKSPVLSFVRLPSAVSHLCLALQSKEWSEIGARPPKKAKREESKKKLM